MNLRYSFLAAVFLTVRHPRMKVKNETCKLGWALAISYNWMFVFVIGGEISYTNLPFAFFTLVLVGALK